MSVERWGGGRRLTLSVTVGTTEGLRLRNGDTSYGDCAVVSWTVKEAEQYWRTKDALLESRLDAEALKPPDIRFATDGDSLECE